MAKKILAVVLAVMVAVSAMAINVFAETIDLYVTSQGLNNGIGTPDNSVVTDTVTVTYTIPIFPLYNYMTSDYHMTFTLPAGDFYTQMGWTADSYSNISWSIWVGGKEYKLQQGDKNQATSEHDVYFGAFTHDFVNGLGTTIPQSTAYGQYTSIELVATFKISDSSSYKADQWAHTWMLNNDAINGTSGNTTWRVELHDNATDALVPNSISYLQSWGGTMDAKASTANVYGAFVTADWTAAWLGNVYTVNNMNAQVLTFDHTLANRSLVASATEGATLHVTTDYPLNGQATYTLWAKKETSVVASNWWQFDSNRKYVGQYKLDGKTSELVFDVPYSALYDANYGVINNEFIIFENITLWNASIMTSYLRYSNSSLADTGYGFNGELGDISNIGGDKAVYYKGEQVRYANGGITSIATLGSTTTEGTEELKVPVVKYVVVGDEYDENAVNKMPELVYDEETFIVEVDPATGTYKVAVDEDGNPVDAKAPYQLVAQYEDGVKILDDQDPIGYTPDGEPVYPFEITEGTEPMYVTIPATEGTTTPLANPHYAGTPNGWNDATNLNNKTPANMVAAWLDFGGEETEVENPAEGTETEEEGENVEEPGDEVDAPEEDEPAAEDNNPGTGIALAVVPMLVAAAAAVVSKKH